MSASDTRIFDLRLIELSNCHKKVEANLVNLNQSVNCPYTQLHVSSLPQWAAKTKPVIAVYYVQVRHKEAIGSSDSSFKNQVKSTWI